MAHFLLSGGTSVAKEAIIRRFQFLPSPSLSQDKINAHPTHKTRKGEKEKSLPREKQTDSSIANRTDANARVRFCLDPSLIIKDNL